jgi:hypothetical protein
MNTTTLWAFARAQNFTYSTDARGQVHVTVPVSHGNLASIMHGLDHLSDHRSIQRYQSNGIMVVVMVKTNQGVPYGN